MRPEFGNATVCGRRTGGWIVGHFIKKSSLRATDEIEIKVGVHEVEGFTDWKSQPGKKSITLLVSGKFLVQFRSGRKTDVFTLRSPGDFVIWEDKREHRWKALTKATVITIRWPSVVKTLKR
jgi:hypothetical protein